MYDWYIFLLVLTAPVHIASYRPDKVDAVHCDFSVGARCPQSPVISDDVMQVKSFLSFPINCLSVPTKLGETLSIDACVAGKDAQRFTFMNSTGLIRSITTGQCVAPGPNASIVLATCNEEDASHAWEYDTFMQSIVHSSNRCMEVRQRSVVLQACNSAGDVYDRADQVWILVTEMPLPNLHWEQIATILDPTKCLSIDVSFQGVLITCQGDAGNNTGFVFDHRTHHILSAGTLQCLDAGLPGSYENVKTLPCAEGITSQQWNINDMDQTIHNVQTDVCLDVSDSSPLENQPVITWPCHGEANQRWSIRHAGFPPRTSHGPEAAKECRCDYGHTCVLLGVVSGVLVFLALAVCFRRKGRLKGL